MKNRILFFLVISSISITSIAQEIVFPALPGYKLQTNYPVFIPDNLWDFINGAADTYLTYEFVDLHVAEYKKGRNVIKLEIYRHSNNTMAFGIYSTERSPSFRFMNLGAQGYNADGAINFFTGNYYVKIKTYSKKLKTLQATETLSFKVASMLRGETKMPALLSRFPSEGKKLNEEMFINESVLGHSFLNKAFKAPYEVGPDNFSIFIFQGNSIDESRKTVATYLASTGIDQVDYGDGKYVLSDGYNGTIFLAWKENSIVVISGLAKDQTAMADKYSSEILR